MPGFALAGLAGLANVIPAQTEIEPPQVLHFVWESAIQLHAVVVQLGHQLPCGL